jgi:predicted transport protein
MLNNKADFILEYNETQSGNLRRDDVDWSQSKVVFVSPSFTAYQRESINFRDLPIELWEVRRHEGQLVAFEQLRPAGATESIRTVSKQSEEIQKVSGEIKVYTEEDHLRGADEDTVELYRTVKEAVLGISGDLVLKPKKMTVAFAIGKKNVADVHLLKGSLKMWLNLRAGELDDPAGLTRDVSKVGHWGTGDYELRIADDGKLDYITGLVRQSYRRNADAQAR